MSLTNKKYTVLAWSFYDFANSSYALLITGVGYQLYFKKVLFAEYLHLADLTWAISISLSIILSAVLSPFLGVISDGFLSRKRIFVTLTYATVLLTCSLAIVPNKFPFLSILIFFLANLSYNLVLFVYDSYLPIIAKSSTIGRISGFAWGLGYLGGIASLIITFSLFSQDPSPADSLGFRIGFLITGLFYLVFSLPSILLLPSVKLSPPFNLMDWKEITQNSFSTLNKTLRSWHEYKHIFRFILAFYCITEAIMTTIYFTANYLSTTFGFNSKEILIATLTIQLIAFPATWLSGYLADKLNLKKALIISTLMWIGIILLIASSKNLISLYIVFFLLGLVIGSTQAIGRAILSNITPMNKLGEFFGFSSFSSKIAATMGPLVFGWISFTTDNQRLAWLSLIPFLVLGLLLLVVNNDVNEDYSLPK
ncbi:MFS transporter [Nodosilinea sp. E11]|uniref:MFS transporter n=1 Tax=Nodosilinea sp. E11 TaxID=3037479 RepID=UPI00293522A8|nr:MFS transporter [Nodosilinea sp. E11]WOD37323.1 MFS transporter [Nodosilinea sp. E11]